MKRFLTAGVLLLCLMSSHIARADEDRNAKIKAEMVENYLLWQEALKLRDAERIISFESPDFTRVFFTNDVLSKDYSDAAWRSYMDSIQKVNDVRVEIKKLTIESNRVMILSNHYSDTDEYSRGDQGKQLHRITRNFQIRDTWVQYDNVWMLKRTEQFKILDLASDNK